METFFRGHECGRICRALSLHKEYPLEFSEDADLDARAGKENTGTGSDDGQDLQVYA